MSILSDLLKEEKLQNLSYEEAISHYKFIQKEIKELSLEVIYYRKEEEYQKQLEKHKKKVLLLKKIKKFIEENYPEILL